jgi:hypothetical protein
LSNILWRYKYGLLTSHLADRRSHWRCAWGRRPRSNAIQKDILQELRAGKGFSAAGAAAELPRYAASAALEAPIPNRNEVLAIAAPCIAEVMGKDVTGLRIVSIKKVG